MKDYREKLVNWPHVDEPTFNRFCECLSAETISSRRSFSMKSEWKRSFYLQENWPIFAPLYIRSVQGYDWGKGDFPNALGTWAPTPNHSNEDGAPFFECQLQLYLLAEIYLVDPLIRLVRPRTYIFLRSFELLESDIDTIIEFIYRFYKSTAPRYGHRIDPLRDLVSRYTATIARELENHEAFRQLLEDHYSSPTDLRTACQLEALEVNW
ncbi:unnamed protein product [Penicillium salamii]|nr:unnamed protein product [Penicillium salamii]